MIYYTFSRNTLFFHLASLPPLKFQRTELWKELCEMVYPNLCPLAGTSIFYSFSLCSQTSSYSFYDTKHSASNSSRSSFEVQLGMCVLRVLWLGVSSFKAPASGFHEKSIYLSCQHVVLSCSSSTAILTEINCAPCSLYSTQEERSFRFTCLFSPPLISSFIIQRHRSWNEG